AADQVLENASPLKLADTFGDQDGRVAGGEQRADDRAHAGPGDQVNWDAFAYDDLQDADMGNPPAAAAAEDKRDLGPHCDPFMDLIGSVSMRRSTLPTNDLGSASRNSISTGTACGSRRRWHSASSS